MWFPMHRRHVRGRVYRWPLRLPLPGKPRGSCEAWVSRCGTPSRNWKNHGKKQDIPLVTIYVYIYNMYTYIFLYRDITFKVGWTTKYLPVLKHGAWTCPLSMGIEAHFFYSRRWSGCSCWRSIEQSLGGFDRWFGVKSLAVLSMGDLQDPKMEVLFHIFGHILWWYSLT
jgi:hypothetical protein